MISSSCARLRLAGALGEDHNRRGPRAGRKRLVRASEGARGNARLCDLGALRHAQPRRLRAFQAGGRIRDDEFPSAGRDREGSNRSNTEGVHRAADARLPGEEPSPIKLSTETLRR